MWIIPVADVMYFKVFYYSNAFPQGGVFINIWIKVIHFMLLFLTFFVDLLPWLTKYFTTKWANKNCHIEVDKGFSYSGNYYMNVFCIVLKTIEMHICNKWLLLMISFFPKLSKIKVCLFRILRLWSPRKILHPELNICSVFMPT